MLNGVHFYHATIKRIVSVFGTIFNNIRVGRHNGDKISNIARVPISYGPRQKFLARVNEKLDEQKVAIKLPRMSFEITSIDYDTSTKLNRMNTTLLPTDSNDPLKRKTQKQTVPYILGMQLNIMARNQEDALQVLEQILPTFTPEYTVTIKDIEGPGSKTDVPFILNSVSLQDDYEGDFQGRRTIIYSLDFTVKIRFAPDTSDTNIIKKVETHIADFTNVSTTNARTLSTVNVSADSPADTIRTFTSLINPDDNQTINLIPTSITQSGLGSVAGVTGISITSGNTPDFDRIEDESFNTPYLNLNGTGGTGTGSIFTANVNGLTGATSSLTIQSGGLHFVVGDTITINDSPYDTTPLVVSVSSVDTPAGAGQSPNASPVGDDGSPINEYGKITGVTFVSGNTAIADRAENYSPIFEREVRPTLVNFTGNNTPSGLILNAKINKLGTVTQFDIVNGGHGYDTPNQLRVSAVELGETASSFTIDNASPTGGTGSGAILKFDIATQDGALSNLQVDGQGINYTVNDILTVDRSIVSANTPNADTPSTNLVARVTAVNASPSEIVGDTPSGLITGIEFVNGDTPQIDRVQGLWDSPYNDIILNVTSIDTIQTDGLYKRNGTLNSRPIYVMNSPIDTINDTPDNNGLTVSYSGAEWQLKTGTRVLSTNRLDSFDPPIGNWIDNTKGGDTSIVFSTTDNALFNTPALVTGNISLGSAVVVSHDSPNKLIVKNLEAEYTDGEIITAGTISRTVINTQIT